jgi:hypothetical protein
MRGIKENATDRAKEQQDSENTSGVKYRDVKKLGAIGVATLAVPAKLTNPSAKSVLQVVKERYDTYVLVIGSDFAGTFATLKARRNDLKVLIVDKGSVGWSGFLPSASDSRPYDNNIYDCNEWLRNMATSLLKDLPDVSAVRLALLSTIHVKTVKLPSSKRAAWLFLLAQGHVRALDFQIGGSRLMVMLQLIKRVPAYWLKIQRNPWDVLR